MNEYKRALIVGAGSGLSAALARRFAAGGLEVALAARNIDKLAPLCAETGAVSFAVDAADPSEVEGLFEALDVTIGAPDVVVYNASFRTRGPFETLDADWQNVIRHSRIGVFSYADSQGSHTPADPAEAIHAVYQASLPPETLIDAIACFTRNLTSADLSRATPLP